MLESAYISTNEKHVYKRMDVGMMLLGLFIEDIQMFTIRHPDVKMSEYLEKIINMDFSQSKSLCSYLMGRSLWCISTCSETLFIPSEHNQKLKKQIVELSIKTLKKEKILSVQLVATRTLVRYVRKINPEDMKQISENFETILDDLLKLLDNSNKEVMHLPIQAF